MELEAAEEGEGFGEVGEEVGCEGCEGCGVGVGLWWWRGGGGHDEGEDGQSVVNIIYLRYIYNRAAKWLWSF